MDDDCYRIRSLSSRLLIQKSARPVSRRRHMYIRDHIQSSSPRGYEDLVDWIERNFLMQLDEWRADSRVLLEISNYAA